MVVPVDDEVRARLGDHGLEAARVREVAAGRRPADMGRVVDEHEPEERLSRQLRQAGLRVLDLGAAELAGGDERRGRDGGGEAQYGERPAPADVGEAVETGQVPLRVGVDRLQEAFQRARDIRVVVAGHEAHRLRRAEPVQEDARAGPLAREPEIAHVARAHDVVGRLLPEVAHERRQEVHVVRFAAAAAPVHVAGEALAEEVPERGSRERPDMRIGQVGETEHRRGRSAALTRPSRRPRRGAALQVSTGCRARGSSRPTCR